MVHTSAVGLGSLSVGLSSGALATALTGFGIVASPVLAGVATLCGLGSVGFAAASKKLERKVTKHEKIYTLAQAKRNSVNELVSQALADKQISDVEFRIEKVYLFLKLFLYFLAKLFFEFLNVWPLCLCGRLLNPSTTRAYRSPEFVILLHFACDTAVSKSDLND